VFQNGPPQPPIQQIASQAN